jgi:hypothetical protein
VELLAADGKGIFKEGNDFSSAHVLGRSLLHGNCKNPLVLRGFCKG